MGVVGTAVRATVIRPGTVWRVPFGLGRGIRLEAAGYRPRWFAPRRWLREHRGERENGSIVAPGRS